ncbi:unnamed protein product [Lampetra fluviatilis]
MPAEHLGTVRTRLLLQLPLLPMKTAATAAAAAAPLTTLLVSTVWAHDAHFRKCATLGSNVTLPCYFEPRKANDGISVQWKLNDSLKIIYCKNNSPSKGVCATWRGDLSVGNASIVITHLRPEDVGKYTCDVICKSEGTWDKTTVQLTVPEQQATTVPVSTIWARDAHFSESATLGSNVTLPCYFEPCEADDLISVQWKLNDCFKILYCTNDGHCNGERETWRGDLSVGNASIAITQLQMEDVGIYTCEVICNNNGTRHKTTIQLVVPEQQAIRAKRRRNLARAGGGDVHAALMSQHPGGQPTSVVHIHIFSGGGGVGGEN